MYDKSHANAWLLVPLRNNLSVVVLALLVLAVLLILILILIVLMGLVLTVLLILILVIHHYTAFSQQIFDGSRGRSHPRSQ
jgi:hypothetical protein